MRRNLFYLSACFMAVLMLTACNGKTIKLGAKDNGGTLSTKQGESLVLSIEGNPTTGYNWEIDSVDQNILQSAGEPEYSQDSNLNPKMTGVGGTYKFKFTAVNPGTTTLKLKYWRSFEPDTPPVETFEVTVNVQ